MNFPRKRIEREEGSGHYRLQIWPQARRRRRRSRLIGMAVTRNLNWTWTQIFIVHLSRLRPRLTITDPHYTQQTVVNKVAMFRQ